MTRRFAATTDALAIELPFASLCIRVAHAFATPAAHDHHKVATTNEQGALQ